MTYYMYSIMEIEMTTKQELKIKIKEVKEEARKLTIEEWAVYLLSENGNSVYQHAAQDIVKSWGMVEFVNGLIALFRTETIRDATPEEIIAWHCRCVWDSCFKTECLGVFAHIRNVECPKNNGTKNPCPARDEWVKAKALLEGKEVILEVI